MVSSLSMQRLLATRHLARLYASKAAGGPAKTIGRDQQNTIPQGLTLKSLKHHYSLIPLFVSLGFAVGLGMVFSMRMLFKASDINWRKEDMPYNAYATKQYKMFNPEGHDYSKQEAPMDLIKELSKEAKKKD